VSKIDAIVFGAGSHARKVAHALSVNGRVVRAFLTSRSTGADSIDRVATYTLKTVPDSFRTDCQVFIGILNHRDPYLQLDDLLRENGFLNISWPWEYYPSLHCELGWCYWLDPEPMTPSQWRNTSDYSSLINLLSDQESRQIFD